jgi:hypothetical protein
MVARLVASRSRWARVRAVQSPPLTVISRRYRSVWARGTIPFDWAVQDDFVTAFAIPPGATGFRKSSTAPLPLVDLELVRAAWHAAAWLAGGRAGELDEQRYPATFHTATIVHRHGQHVMLCHAHYPLLAFVSGYCDWHTVEFIDPPGLADQYVGAGFATLTASVLLSPLADVDTSAILDEEWRQIRYWQPATVGAALFNRWD